MKVGIYGQPKMKVTKKYIHILVDILQRDNNTIVF
jgi:hypothetical protein